MTGETPNQNPTQEGGEKTYTQTEMQQLLDAAKAEAEKAGTTKAWSHWQSVTDKQIQAFKTDTASELEQLRGQVAAARKAHLEALSPDERQKAMLEELYERQMGPQEPPKQEPPKPEPPEQDETATAMRKQISDTLKGLGVDPDKVNWGTGKDGAEDLKVFIASILEQQKPKEDGVKNDEVNRTSTSRSVSGAVDFLKDDPADIVRRGYETMGRIRGET